MQESTIIFTPVEAGLVKRPEDWEFSSYREYIGLRNGTLPAPEIVLSFELRTRSWILIITGSLRC